MAPGETLTGKEGKPLPGFLNASAGKGKPAVVIVHEWWGLNDQIRGVADRYAKEGFVAFAVDLYHGKVARTEEEAEALMQAMDWGRAVADVRAAVEALQARDPGAKVGITGFCMGGAVALAAAANIPALAAVVPFYGIPPDVDLTKIRGKVQGHYANIDNWCSPDRVDALEKTLRDGGVSVEIHRYDAQHAFFNEKRKEVHSPENAQRAWGRAVAFL